MTDITHTPIGIIHSSFTDPDDTPIQGVFANEAKGEVEVFPEYAVGLKDIDGFSHLILIYNFHLVNDYSLISKPFIEGKESKDRGIFSIRHPERPNHIGISIVTLNAVRGNILEISDVDIIDGTPLLDIKPFVHRFDNRIGVKSGWVDEQHIDEIKDQTPRALRDK
ncbi:MAG TPA: tRNA (N6-threonylcarbamoyladenosine(37)-N6)-methyltransferase TrmO [Methanosarcinaceae archaeon]|nr:tRNA (N6-threonylcarbamoyladenosine(37)-N6)-methyltransferase TrmO [Methanosarcinaceae archaeon]